MNTALEFIHLPNTSAKDLLGLIKLARQAGATNDAATLAMLANDEAALTAEIERRYSGIHFSVTGEWFVGALPWTLAQIMLEDAGRIDEEDFREFLDELRYCAIGKTVEWEEPFNGIERWTRVPAPITKDSSTHTGWALVTRRYE